MLRSEDPRLEVRGRVIAATNISTRQTYHARTSDDGVFAFLVPAGGYRLSMTLGRHEAIVKAPGEVTVGSGDASVGANIWVNRR